MKKGKVKKPIYKKWWVWLLAVIIIGSVVSGMGDDDGKTTDQTKTTVPISEGKTTASAADSTTPVETDAPESTTPVETDAPESTTPEETDTLEGLSTFGIGDSAKVADVVFTVTKVKETKEIKSSNQFIENAKTDGKFVILDITVKNEKKEAITINSSFFKLLTSDDVEYEPNTDGAVMMAMMSENDFFLKQVNPGLSKKGKIVFEVGEDFELNTASLKAQTGYWGTETVEISLKK